MVPNFGKSWPMVCCNFSKTQLLYRLMRPDWTNRAQLFKANDVVS